MAAENVYHSNSAHGWIINLDNLSHVRDWLSDALCRISTGGGFGARQLYTNTDEVLFEAKRPSSSTARSDMSR